MYIQVRDSVEWGFKSIKMEGISGVEVTMRRLPGPHHPSWLSAAPKLKPCPLWMSVLRLLLSKGTMLCPHRLIGRERRGVGYGWYVVEGGELEDLLESLRRARATFHIHPCFRPSPLSGRELHLRPSPSPRSCMKSESE